MIRLGFLKLRGRVIRIMPKKYLVYSASLG